VQDLDKLKKEKSLKVYEGRENRVIFIGMDQNRGRIALSDVKGKNPFKDKRVRQAMYQAVDVNALKTTVMRGLSVPTAINLPAPVQAGIPASIGQALSGGTRSPRRSCSPSRDTRTASPSPSIAQRPLHQRRAYLHRARRQCGRRSA
jgi:ABC-type transport system substrate-binding protein